MWEIILIYSFFIYCVKRQETVGKVCYTTLFKKEWL